MAKEHKETFDKLKSDIEWKETNNARSNLLGDRPAKVVDYSSNDGLINHGKEVLDESKQSLARSVGAMQDSLALGRDTAAKLQNQTDQIVRIHDNLEAIDDALERSKRIMTRMARRVATDKCMWILALLVIAAIIAIVVYKTKNKDDSDALVPNF